MSSSVFFRQGFAFLAGTLLASAAYAEAPQATHLRFQFGAGKAAQGYSRVPAGAAYDKQRGYGFEGGARIESVDCGGDDPLHAGYCTSDKPFFFSTNLPEGNYKVTVTLGDSRREATVTVKAELRRLMLENIHTPAGLFAAKSFVVNVRTPRIAGGGQVALKNPRETTDEAWAWDERLTLEFNGPRPCLCALEIERVETPTVFILGDSTVCDQAKEPYASWGQMLPRFFKPEVAVANHAESGESLRSSTGARRLAKVLGDVRPGDYLFIQYGHNDMKAREPDAAKTYKATLKQWVEQVRSKGGIPVLITPMHRYQFDGNTVVNTFGEYPEMVREAAREENAALVDLNAMSKTLYESLGKKCAIQAFKHDSDDDPKFDHTHHSPYGAYELAKCVVAGIRAAKLDLAQHLADNMPPFDPVRPDPIAEFKVPPSPGFTRQRPLGD